MALAGKDLYQRSLGRVWCGGLDANAEQVLRGMAWVYDHYVTDRSLYALQAAVRARRGGLWADAAPVPPWQWRRGIRSATAADSPPPGVTRSGPVMGNRRSGIYHLPRCPSYGDISPRNRVPFASADAARAAGYRQAGNCP